MSTWIISRKDDNTLRLGAVGDRWIWVDPSSELAHLARNGFDTEEEASDFLGLLPWRMKKHAIAREVPSQ